MASFTLPTVAETSPRTARTMVAFEWRIILALFVVLIVTGTAAGADAQPASLSRQVVSANPFGLLLGLFNAEYERTVSESTTAGVGGSFFNDDDDDDYVNADVFYRYYPSGRPLQGFAFGVKAGVTRVTSEGTFFGFGFDSNWSWLLGRDDRFYVGLGFGLKRLFGRSESQGDPTVIPTVRVVNIGFAF